MHGQQNVKFCDKECVYCVVRIESLNTIQVNLSFKGLKFYLEYDNSCRIRSGVQVSEIALDP
jgi:hypothetical protein